MKTNKGFSLVELMIVVAIIAVLGTIASSTWSRYVFNSNLRAAARDIVSNFNIMKTGAAAQQDTTFTIDFNKTAGTYTMTGLTTQTKALTSYGQGITFSYLPNNVTTFTLTFLARGTLSPVTGDTTVDNVKLKNSRGSIAQITFNTTGKTYVTFTMQ